MNILIVDDEQMQRGLLEGFLEKQGYTVTSASGGREALEVFAANPIDLVLLDHRMEDMNGDEVLARLKSSNPLLHAIMITAYGSVDTAVRVMQLGADDFFEKPVDLEKLLLRIQQLEEKLVVGQEAKEVRQSIETDKLPIKLIGESPAMQEVLSMVRRAAPTPWTVLIRGQTGTGKEMIARLLHLLSKRAEKPFIELNCAAVPETLFESELFGH
jgi:two-component system response regulator AtoC